MNITIDGFTINGNPDEICDLMKLMSKKEIDIPLLSVSTPTNDKRKNSSYASGQRPWKAGRHRDPNSRTQVAIRMIGCDGKSFTDLVPGSIEQRNFWRAIEFLRGRSKSFNPIK